MILNIELLKKLRTATGLGMDLCKTALEKSNGDFDLAVEELRKSGVLTYAKLNPTNRGSIFSYCHSNGQCAAFLELTCETESGVKSELFQKFGQDLVAQLAGMPNVLFLSEKEIPSDKKKEYRLTAEEQLTGKNSTKKIPSEKLPMILDGKMRSWYSEVCFLESKSPVVSKKTIRELLADFSSQIGESVQITRIVRWDR